MMLEEPPFLTDDEWDAIFRDGATDEEIESVLRHVFYWAWIVRDPLGKVCATGRDATRVEAIRCAFELADATPSISSRRSPTRWTRYAQ
jgi:hypothetical protein